ncbi:hypothetical protein Cri9333_1086 [Crinalium epipsammum PCC 9333]|uniref:Right handed beta helix domain-containing protein n=1 Tax=Crinalium epipsammum PCC 9333 TaxID=1173022 RepID=K9VWW5_9CYAN|nr:hypothetical protein Cri9333_1086 [Crinalium epipsammum PCC 9333]
MRKLLTTNTQKYKKTSLGNQINFIQQTIRKFPLASSLLPSCLYFAILSLVVNAPVAAVPTSTCQDTELIPPDCYPQKLTSKTGEVLHIRVTVNSNQDGAIKPDAVLSLREAIQIVNGTLAVERLSDAEKAGVESLNANTPSRIEFNLPPDQTTIPLIKALPPLASPGLVIDGTTQPGYDAKKSATAEIAIPIPVVAITTAENVEVLRGLTIIADGVTIRGLNLYGFTAKSDRTALTPPADIFIAHRLIPADRSEQKSPGKFLPFYEGNIPPKNVVIENNWLGILSNGRVPVTTSAFGVSVFNSLGTMIRRNRIANHDGSGIITSVKAENLQVIENIIDNNGLAGIPDAIRLEGVINQSQVSSNLICGNNGSGVFLFKPQGAVKIENNQIKLNGRSFRRAAIYLMGNDHQVMGNQISNQTGSGVVVASFPKSDRNLIQNNKFAGLEGLSIDLITQQNVRVEDFQQGDGPNPLRNSPNRRLETGNSAINAPEFLAREFLVIDGKVNVDGKADPGSQIDIYRVSENNAKTTATNYYLANYHPLSELLRTVTTDAEGRFGATLLNLQPGDKISAIATDPQYGTSEPAFNAVVRFVDGAIPIKSTVTDVAIPQCLTNSAIAPTARKQSQAISLGLFRNNHFASDKYNITPASATQLKQIVENLLMRKTIERQAQNQQVEVREGNYEK